MKFYVLEKVRIEIMRINIIFSFNKIDYVTERTRIITVVSFHIKQREQFAVVCVKIFAGEDKSQLNFCVILTFLFQLQKGKCFHASQTPSIFRLM